MGFGVGSVGSGEVWMVLLRSGGSELPGQSGWSATSLTSPVELTSTAYLYEVLTSPVGFWVQFIFQD